MHLGGSFGERNERDRAMNYYNEFDPKAAAWLRSLIDAELIPPGHVDDRSILEVRPRDLDGYTQCHFFAGIGGWPLALRLANWPTDRPVWTGSCPCQPFSSAGKGKGVNDERHLWPEFARLIGECKPTTVFGEQVASKAGRGWLDGVFADLEDLDYRCGAADLCAASAGAPHIRQRLFWVADSGREQLCGDAGAVRAEEAECDSQREFDGLHHIDAGYGCQVRSGVSDAEVPERKRHGAEQNREPCGPANNGGLGDTNSGRREQAGHSQPESNSEAIHRQSASGHSSAGPWSDFDIILCVEPTKEPGRYVEKRRRIESGTLPLAHGIPGRVAQLRGLGNAIVPQVAAEFILAAKVDSQP